MGRNSFGQLAHHDTQDRNLLSRVEGLPPVRQIAVGRDHCVVLTRDERVTICIIQGPKLLKGGHKHV